MEHIAMDATSPFSEIAISLAILALIAPLQLLLAHLMLDLLPDFLQGIKGKYPNLHAMKVCLILKIATITNGLIALIRL